MSVDITVEGLEELKKWIDKYPQISRKEVDTAFLRSLTRIWGEEKKEAPFGVSGELRDRWSIERSPFEARFKADTEYALYVHEGTKPHFPPREYLEPWANKHGIPVFLVQMAIAKKGTKANKFLDRAVKNAEGGVNTELAAALERIVSAVK